MVRVLASSTIDRGFIGGIMVRVLASSAIDRGFDPVRGKPKTIKLVFFASPLSTQN